MKGSPVSTPDDIIASSTTDATTGDWVIPRDQSIELMASTPIGRMAFVVDGHPMVLPVNFAWHEDGVVFRTLPGQKLHAATEGQQVCFEVDHWDPDVQSGWSVVVVGKARQVTNFAEQELLENIGLVPWAKGTWRPKWVRIEPEQITGRRLRGQK